jgi:AraC-like DNA-binding protein
MSSPSVVRPTIPARYLVELLAHTGVDAAALLASAGLPPKASIRDRFRASVEQFERLYALTMRVGDDELFGFFEQKVPRGAYAATLRLATGSRDLGAFFESVARLYALFDEATRPFVVERDGDLAVLRLSYRTAHQRRSILYTHSILLTMWRSAAWLAGETIPLRRVRLDPRFRAYGQETAYLFGRELELVPRAAEIAFDGSWLRTPSRRSPEDADAWVRTSLRTMLAAAAGDSLEARVRSVLAADEPIASSDLTSVARRLRMSRATLTRRLQASGLGFQEIKDALRRDHAIALLTGARRDVADVAYRLGFSEPSAFARAFKSWTGVPPGRYRNG